MSCKATQILFKYIHHPVRIDTFSETKIQLILFCCCITEYSFLAFQILNYRVYLIFIIIKPLQKKTILVGLS